jgi:predicted component of type VI protein secretion system
MREVFLSHASHDQAKARRLRNKLVAYGIPVWFSAHHIRGAQQWQDEIGKALARCDWFLLLLTPHAVESMWVKREVNFVLSEKRYQERILPLIFKECDYRALSWTLPQFQMIDFTKDYSRALEQLLHNWRIPLKRRSRKKRD